MRRRRILLIVAAAFAVAVASCSGPPGHETVPRRSSHSIPPTSPTHSGEVARLLDRPLRFPKVGRTCPVSSTHTVSTANFGGVAVGDDPVRPIVVSYGEKLHGAVVPLSRSDVAGWLAIKTLWYSTPAYTGPIVIRAARLDAPGAVGMGGSGPSRGPLVIRSGAGANDGGGYRTSPGGTWVKTAGCYGWQVDGTTFSHEIIIKAIKSG